MSYIHPGSLSSLFNTLPRHSALRLPVYKTLVELASLNDELYVLQVSRSDVENWLKEWDITPTEKSAFLKTLVDAFSKASQSYVPHHHYLHHRLRLFNHPLPKSNRDTAYHYKLAHVRSLEPTLQSTQPVALDAIATALSNPAVFDFDPLFKLDAVIATKSHPLFALLQIFLNGGLDGLHTWQRANADVSSSFGALPSVFPPPKTVPTSSMLT